MRSRSTLFRLLLTALLLFSQHQAVLHLLAHGLAQVAVDSSTQRESPDPGELVCAKCLAIAHLDHAVSSGVPSLDLVDPAPQPFADVAFPHRDLAFFASYRSRAPPVLS